ncbi:MAG: DUF3368 domain-containing protein [Anaerolineae bacterium]|nr:DUF3368 domain-containing protein [Anaerolineae bacterium]
MPSAISNTSPLVYLHRVGALNLLPQIFGEVCTTSATEQELLEGKMRSYEVPIVGETAWLKIINPSNTPAEWFALDLGPGEIAAMALALEKPDQIVLLDDALARRIAQAAGLQVWGTLRVVLEAKKQGFVPEIAPIILHLGESGMWISEAIKQRILDLAGE